MVHFDPPVATALACGGPCAGPASSARGIIILSLAHLHSRSCKLSWDLALCPPWPPQPTVLWTELQGEGTVWRGRSGRGVRPSPRPSQLRVRAAVCTALSGLRPRVHTDAAGSVATRPLWTAFPSERRLAPLFSAQPVTRAQHLLTVVFAGRTYIQ